MLWLLIVYSASVNCNATLSVFQGERRSLCPQHPGTQKVSWTPARINLLSVPGSPGLRRKARLCPAGAACASDLKRVIMTLAIGVLTGPHSCQKAMDPWNAWRRNRLPPACGLQHVLMSVHTACVCLHPRECYMDGRLTSCPNTLTAMAAHQQLNPLKSISLGSAVGLHLWTHAETQSMTGFKINPTA